MKFYQINIMMPLSYTITALSKQSAQIAARKLVAGKVKEGELAPILHSVEELKDTDEKPPTTAV